MQKAHASFKDLTTLRVGGEIGDFRYVDTPEELASCVREADAAASQVLVLGEGSNLLASDEPFAGMVVKAHDPAGPVVLAGTDSVRVRIHAGCVWDDFVTWCVERNLSGVEALSGIPGQIGSAVMQNLGAYGQEIGTCLVGATLLDRTDGQVRTYSKDELGLGYRTSILRRSMEGNLTSRPWPVSPRWIVLSAELELAKAAQGTVAHPQLAAALGCEVGSSMPVGVIRDKVYEVRASKGMVCDPDPTGANPYHDRWSSGSFFTNPVLTRQKAHECLPVDAPLYPTHDEALVKTSAAWLIERAGFAKGYGVDGAGSPATLSNLHTLALTNRGNASAADIVRLACTVRNGVWQRFGVKLEPETVLVGLSLD